MIEYVGTTCPITVRLDGKAVGKITKLPDRVEDREIQSQYQYIPVGQVIGGEVFQTIEEVKRSLKEPAEEPKQSPGRTYTVTKNDGPASYSRTVYHGFNRRFLPASELDAIAVVLVEGEVELYAIENTSKAKSEFVKFLADEECGGFLAGVYKRI